MSLVTIRSRAAVYFLFASALAAGTPALPDKGGDTWNWAYNNASQVSGGMINVPLIAGPRADPGDDGLENLAEYALGSNPGLPDSTAAPVSSRDGEVLRMTWRESTGATDVVIEPQWSGEMLLWEPSALTIETLAFGDGWMEKRATLNTASRPRACLRLHVVLP